MLKILIIIGKFVIGTASFKGGFWGGVFGVIMVLWAIIDIIDILGMV